jgi:hypothetical protein
VWAGAECPPTPPTIPLQGIGMCHIEDVGNHQKFVGLVLPTYVGKEKTSGCKLWRVAVMWGIMRRTRVLVRV